MTAPHSPSGGARIFRLCHVATVDFSIRFNVLNLLLYNQLRRWDVHVVASPGDHVEAIERTGIHFHAVPITRRLTPFLDLVSLIRLVALFRREKFDVVHVHSPKGSFLGAMAAWIVGVPVRFYTIHGYYFHPDMPAYKARFYRFFEYLTSRFVHHAFTVNREDRATAIRLGYFPDDRITYVGGGIDLSKFVPSAISPSRREEIRRSIGLAPEDRVVGFIGRLVREKGMIELLEAYKSLKGKLPDLRLLIVGSLDPEKKDAISPSIARDLGVEDVIFAGMRLDIPDMLSAMDAFALPSYREGFSQSIMEASAMGVPVITTNVRGCREAVEDGKTGIIVPVRDPSRLAEAIHSILTDPELAMRLGEAGRAKALMEFDELARFRIIRNKYLQQTGMPPEE